MTAAARLAVDCASKAFGGRVVLRSASLRAVPGQLRALLGRNGAGKSTLLRMAAGVLAADTGMVFLDGRPEPSPNAARFAREGVLMVPADGFFATSVPIGTQLDWLAAPGAAASPAAVLAQLGVPHAATARAHTLSGGEVRRAEVAAMLVRAPRVLLADEPCAGIAPRDAEVVAQALRTLAAGGCAVVVTGHEVETLLTCADHVTWCTDGTSYELGAPAQARADERFRRGYLGVAATASR